IAQAEVQSQVFAHRPGVLKEGALVILPEVRVSSRLLLEVEPVRLCRGIRNEALSHGSHRTGQIVKDGFRAAGIGGLQALKARTIDSLDRIVAVTKRRYWKWPARHVPRV